jgi:hypothetical protein
VYLGVFDRAAGEAVGWFDETLIRNQDYELNIRLRKAGGEVWFDPALSVGYRPRGSWRALAEQYYEYGWWKAEVVRRHPESLRLRQVVPPVAVTAAVIGGFVGVRWRPALLAPIGYLVALGSTLRRGSRRSVPPILATMHASWVVGLWSGRWLNRDGGSSDGGRR